MSLILIAIFSFLAAVSLVVILFMLPMAVQDTAQARIKRRLTAIGKLDYASKAEIQSLLKTSIYSEIPWLNEILAKQRLMQRIDLLLERANIDMTPGLFLLCSVGAAGVTYVLCSLLGQPTACSDHFFSHRVSVSLRLRSICHLEEVAQISRTIPRWTRHDRSESSGRVGSHPSDGLRR